MKDIYLKFVKKTNSKDIIGESEDSEHKTWVEVTSWAQGIHQPTSATASTAGGHSSERCEHITMLFTKDVDKASVYLWEACSAGYTYDVEIKFFRASGTVRTNYLTVKLTDAIVSTVQSSVGIEGLPTETFGLKYAEIIWAYKGSKTDGSANVGNDVGGWSLSKNKVAA